MYSGTASRDELTATFRTLSQKRRQGVLTIASGEEVYIIAFHNGKVVDVERSGENKVHTLLEKFVHLRALSEMVAEVIGETVQTIAELYDATVKKEYLSHQHFVRAKHSIEMNHLYSLRTIGAGTFEFIPKIVHADPVFGISISAGQLLLDMVELDTEEKRFQGAFQDEKVLVVDTSIHGQLSSLEEETFQAVSDIHSCLDDIRKKTILTEYELRQGLLSLYEKKCIRYEDSVSKIKTTSNASMIDQAAHYLADIDDTQDEGIEEVRQFLENELSKENQEFSPENSGLYSHEGETSSLNPNNSESNQGSQNVFRRRERLLSPLVSLNCFILQPKVFSAMSLAISLIFLISTALVVPTYFGSWFSALSEFGLKE